MLPGLVLRHACPTPSEWPYVPKIFVLTYGDELFIVQHFIVHPDGTVHNLVYKEFFDEQEAIRYFDSEVQK